MAKNRILVKIPTHTMRAFEYHFKDFRKKILEIVGTNIVDIDRFTYEIETRKCVIRFISAHRATPYFLKGRRYDLCFGFDKETACYFSKNTLVDCRPIDDLMRYIEEQEELENDQSRH